MDTTYGAPHFGSVPRGELTTASTSTQPPTSRRPHVSRVNSVLLWTCSFSAAVQIVRFTFALTLLLAAASNAQPYCQCLFNYGSHCCVTSIAHQDCTANCLNESQLCKPGSVCKAGDKNSKVGPGNQQGPMKCMGYQDGRYFLAAMSSVSITPGMGEVRVDKASGY